LPCPSQRQQPENLIEALSVEVVVATEGAIALMLVIVLTIGAELSVPVVAIVLIIGAELSVPVVAIVLIIGAELSVPVVVIAPAVT
jgi:hypothetical protein